jgi:large subunit ribosomal protein L2
MAEYKLLTKKRPEKKLVKYLKRRAGRAHSGRITVRHRGGGAKRLYRIVDFSQKGLAKEAKVLSLEYDPYRTAFICLLEYPDKTRTYSLAPQGLKVGDKVLIAEREEIKAGNRLRLKNIPVGTMVYNIELRPGQGGKLVRAAGTAAKVLAHEGKYSNIEMPSKEIRKVLSECFVTVGQVSHPEHRYRRRGKAGLTRLKGIRPRVRGSAMNPVDHPHGGGEGRAPIGLKHPKTPWGKPARGVKTRRRKDTDKYILKRRERKRK